MSANTVALIAAATHAALQIKHAETASKEAVNEAFIQSAITTHTALKGRVSARALADSNKAAGAGYGSAAAVLYHSLAGQVLSLPVDEFDGSAKSIQTLIKKLDAATAKTVITKAKTVDQAIELLTAALTDEVDQVKVLKAALKLIQEVELDRVNGNELQEGAIDIVNSLVAALINVETEVNADDLVDA